jgi:hypothetical protein
LSISYHYSTYFSSIFSISFHNFLLYFPNLFTIRLGFLPYFFISCHNCFLSRIVIRYGQHGRKASWNVKWYGKYGRKISCTVKWFGKYGRKASRIVIRYYSTLVSSIFFIIQLTFLQYFPYLFTIFFCIFQIFSLFILHFCHNLIYKMRKKRMLNCKIIWKYGRKES